MIYFTKYLSSDSIKILSLRYNEFMGKIEAHERNKNLMFDDHMVTEILNKIKNIRGIEKSNNTKILIDADDRLRDDIPFKKFVMLNKYIKINGSIFC